MSIPVARCVLLFLLSAVAQAGYYMDDTNATIRYFASVQNNSWFPLNSSGSDHISNPNNGSTVLLDYNRLYNGTGLVTLHCIPCITLTLVITTGYVCRRRCGGSSSCTNRSLSIVSKGNDTNPSQFTIPFTGEISTHLSVNCLLIIAQIRFWYHRVWSGDEPHRPQLYRVSGRGVGSCTKPNTTTTGIITLCLQCFPLRHPITALCPPRSHNDTR
jgi:hypothetical protein